MTREEYVKVCGACKNRAFDRDQGIICSYTKTIADFNQTCINYSEDVEQKEKMVVKARINEQYEEVSKSSGTRDIIFGGLWFVGGVIGTLSDTGFIFYGAIIFGAIQLVKGFVASSAGK